MKFSTSQPTSDVLVNEGQRNVDGEELNGQLKGTGCGNEGDNFCEEFVVTVVKGEMNSSLLSPENIGKEEGQRSSSSCSCHEEIKILKDAVKQLSMQVNKQNEVIKGIKSSVRNAVLSLMTCCEDEEEEEDHEGLQDVQESPIIVRNFSKTVGEGVAEDPLLLDNLKSFTSTDTNQEVAHQENYEDNCSSITIVKRSDDSASAGDKDGDVDVEEDADVQYDDTGSIYIPDDSEGKSDQDMEDYDNHYGSGTKSARLSNENKSSLLKCQLCPKVFSGNGSLYFHIKAVHEGVQYKCSHCPATFTRFAIVKRHENVVHKEGKEGTHKCDICGVHFANSASLKVHVGKTHKKIEEGMSSRSKLSQETIRRKRGMTTANIIFQFQLCPISFSKSEDLRSHQSEVHGINLGAEVNK